VSQIGETISGQSTIRAFGKTHDFIRENNRLLNNHILSIHWQQAIITWFSIRLDIITVFFMGLACFLGITMRHHADPIFIAMMLSYVLML
jgi:ABC-type multidrug transport system fused ATPase/permease subunit